MTDANDRVAEFIEAARRGKWSRRQVRNAVFRYGLREHRDAIFAALGFVAWCDPQDVGPDGHVRSERPG